MTNFEKAAVAFLSVIAVGLIGVVAWLYQQKWRQPLGPALQISTVIPYRTPSVATPMTDVSLRFGAGSPAKTPFFTQLPGPGSSALLAPATSTSISGQCGAPSVMTILVIGSDTRSDKYLYGLADAIRVVRIDTVIPKVTVLDFPRDLWVQIPDVADNLNGQDHEKLNQSYLYGNPGFGYTDDPAQGPGLLARTLALNFGTRIDHYAAVNMRTFIKIVDAVGGIDVTLTDSVDGRTAEDTNERLLFSKGENHLDGTRALTLARIRIEGTFARADNQNLVLCALRRKLTSRAILTSLPDLIKSFQGAVQTDLSPAQLSQLACIASQLPPANIAFTHFPENIFTQSRVYDPVFKERVFVLEADYDILRNYVGRFNDGRWPEAIPVALVGSEQGDSQVCQ